MSENLPGKPAFLGRHEPPPVPAQQEPPPVPGGERELATRAQHEPPPVPVTYEEPSIAREELSIAFVLEESPNAELAGPSRSNFESPFAPSVETGRTSDETVISAGLPAPRQPSAFLPWFAFSLALLCLPPSIVAGFFFLSGFELWPFVLICSLLAVCFGRYARDRGGPSAKLAGLAVQLGRGFFAIGLVGLAMIGLAAAMWGISTVQAFNTEWQQTNRSVRWVTDKVDAVEAFFTGKGHKPAAEPSPSPNSSPGS
jgi:hypothetical protein